MTGSQQSRQDKKRGRTKMAADRNKVTTGIHTTTDTNRERDGADNIHHEGSGRQTPQNEDKCLSATTLNQKTRDIMKLCGTENMTDFFET
jgi:hypothetical protein